MHLLTINVNCVGTPEFIYGIDEFGVKCKATEHSN